MLQRVSLHYLGCLMPPVFPRTAKCSSSVRSFTVIGCWMRLSRTEILAERNEHPLSSVSSHFCTVFDLLTLLCASGVTAFLLVMVHVAADSSIIKLQCQQTNKKILILKWHCIAASLLIFSRDAYSTYTFLYKHSLSIILDHWVLTQWLNLNTF